LCKKKNAKGKNTEQKLKMKSFCTLICHFDFLSLTFNFQGRNVVAQFIGRLFLITQGNYKIRG